MKLKALLEKRAALVAEMKELNEKRDFENFNAKNAELEQLDVEIAAEKRVLELNEDSTIVNSQKEERDYNAEIRQAFENGTELDVTDFEVEDRAMGIGEVQGSVEKSVGNIKKTTFANYIIKKLPYVSRLYAACRKEPLSSASHTIPVQKTKIGKLVKMKELQNYVAQNADYDKIDCKPHKFGTLFVVSDELVEDTGYDIKADLQEQVLESYGLTLDELIIKGDSELNIDGFNDFNVSTGAHEVEQANTGVITVEELMAIYYACPRQYRKNATWVFNDETARAIASLKDADGRPLLMPSYNGAPFDEGSLLLGRPVIINDHVASLNEVGKAIFFGDIQRSYLVAPRKSFTIKTSSEYGFINDSQATKVNVRLDAKKTLEEAMVYFTSKAAMLTAKTTKTK